MLWIDLEWARLTCAQSTYFVTRHNPETQTGGLRPARRLIFLLCGKKVSNETHPMSPPAIAGACAPGIFRGSL